MLIPSEIEFNIFSNVLSKTFEQGYASGTVVIGRLLKPTSGYRFTQEIHVENLETSFEIQKAIQLDENLHKEILTKLINNALEKAKSNMEIK